MTADLQAQRAALPESTMLEASGTADVFGLVVDTLMERWLSFSGDLTASAIGILMNPHSGGRFGGPPQRC